MTNCPTKSGGGEGFGFISQMDKNRRRFRLSGTCTGSSSRRSRLSSHAYNLQSPINTQPGQGRVLSLRSLGSSVPAPIALHLGAQAHGWQTYWFCNSPPADDRPPTVPPPPAHTARSLPVARRLDYCRKKDEKKNSVTIIHIYIYRYAAYKYAKPGNPADMTWHAIPAINNHQTRYYDTNFIQQ